MNDVDLGRLITKELLKSVSPLYLRSAGWMREVQREGEGGGDSQYDGQSQVLNRWSSHKDQQESALA